MKTTPTKAQSGIALIAVMIAIFLLSVLAGAFAYAMKVETKLAMNSNNDTEATYLGLSGVEYARWILAQQASLAGEPYDSLNQKWAGGPGGLAVSNSPLAEISLDNVPVGNGFISIKITDLERKFNINVDYQGGKQELLERALTAAGVDGGEIPAISSSILDWIDKDDLFVAGAESEYYQSLDPPYYAKNRPIDDLSELLLVRGLTQDMYWGAASTNHTPAAFQKVDRYGRPSLEQINTIGLVEIFTPLSSGKININTAPIAVLQIIPGLDEYSAAEIIKQRSGPDGAEGTEDDTPFRSVGDGLDPRLVQLLQRFCDVRSRTFEVKVDVNIRGSKRTFYATVIRNNPKDIQLLSFYWK